MAQFSNTAFWNGMAYVSNLGTLTMKVIVRNTMSIWLNIKSVLTWNFMCF